MYIERLFDCITFQMERYPQDIALSYASSNGWNHYSTSEIIQLSKELSIGLSEIGIQRWDNVCIISNYSSAWWIILDMALQQIGAIVVPIHATATNEQIIYILNETESQYCFVSNNELKERIEQFQNKLEYLKSIYLYLVVV